MREIKFRAWDKKEKKMYLVWGMSKISLSVNTMHYNDIENYEVMQYTGLKDKDGKEIYEGDIVKRFNHEKSCDVVWNEQDGGFWLRWLNDGLPWIHITDDLTFNWVVVGNIYENPQLLTK